LYDQLYEAWKKEKLTEQLQTLPPNFYSELSKYAKRLKEDQRMLDEKSLKAKLLRSEIERARKLLSQLVDLRFNKIAQTTIKKDSIPPNSLSREEEQAYKNSIEIVKLRETLIKNLFEGKEAEAALKPKEDKLERILVRFTREMPAIVGTDMKSYGPFKAEDIATLPLQNAEALLRQGVAIRIEASK